MAFYREMFVNLGVFIIYHTRLYRDKKASYILHTPTCILKLTFWLINVFFMRTKGYLKQFQTLKKHERYMSDKYDIFTLKPSYLQQIHIYAKLTEHLNFNESKLHKGRCLETKFSIVLIFFLTFASKNYGSRNKTQCYLKALKCCSLFFFKKFLT